MKQIYRQVRVGMTLSLFSVALVMVSCKAKDATGSQEATLQESKDTEPFVGTSNSNIEANVEAKKVSLLDEPEPEPMNCYDAKLEVCVEAAELLRKGGKNDFFQNKKIQRFFSEVDESCRVELELALEKFAQYKKGGIGKCVELMGALGPT